MPGPWWGRCIRAHHVARLSALQIVLSVALGRDAREKPLICQVSQSRVGGLATLREPLQDAPGINSSRQAAMAASVLPVGINQ